MSYSLIRHALSKRLSFNRFHRLRAGNVRFHRIARKACGSPVKAYRLPVHRLIPWGRQVSSDHFILHLEESLSRIILDEEFPCKSGYPVAWNNICVIVDTCLIAFLQQRGRFLHFMQAAADHTFVNLVEGRQVNFPYRVKCIGKEAIFCDPSLRDIQIITRSADDFTELHTGNKAGDVIEIRQYCPRLLRHDRYKKGDVNDNAPAIVPDFDFNFLITASGSWSIEKDSEQKGGGCSVKFSPQDPVHSIKIMIN